MYITDVSNDVPLLVCRKVVSTEASTVVRNIVKNGLVACLDIHVCSANLCCTDPNVSNTFLASLRVYFEVFIIHVIRFKGTSHQFMYVSFKLRSTQQSYKGARLSLMRGEGWERDQIGTGMMKN